VRSSLPPTIVYHDPPPRKMKNLVDPDKTG
jgi:hypothetical protein